MTQRLVYTVLVDGPSDRALLPIIDWLLYDVGVRYPVMGQEVTPSMLRRINSHIGPLEERIPLALDLFPCHLLVIHRDSEAQGLHSRLKEITSAVERLSRDYDSLPPIAFAVPVRMHESWLLFSEEAIRRAADNPHGSAPLSIPPITFIESISDPKSLLDELLRSASGLHGARLSKFNCNKARARIVSWIDDFSPLLALPAIQTLRSSLEESLRYSGWI